MKRGVIAGVGLEPDLERHIERRAKLRILRGMDMQIDQTWNNDVPGRQRQQRCGRRALGQRSRITPILRLQDGSDAAGAVDGDQGISEDLYRADKRSMKEGRADRIVTDVAERRSRFHLDSRAIASFPKRRSLAKRPQPRTRTDRFFISPVE
jgi:hypothetical protein